jgi:hypothetical protein
VNGTKLQARKAADLQNRSALGSVLAFWKVECHNVAALAQALGFPAGCFQIEQWTRTRPVPTAGRELNFTQEENSVSTTKRTSLLIFAVFLLTPLCLANCYALQDNTKKVPTIKEGSLIRAEKDPKVYLVQGNQRHLIPDEATLRSKGSLSEVVSVPKNVADAIPLGAPVPSVAQAPTVKEGSLIRAEKDPKVYLVQGNERHWIPDEATLRSKGSLSQVVSVPKSVADAIPLGAPVPSVAQAPTVKEGSLIRAEKDPKVYLVQGNERHWIPDEATLRSKGSLSQVVSVPKSVADAIPLGAPVPSVVKKH